MSDTLLIVDGNSILHRAFHAMPDMDADGVPTGAAFGFFSMLIKVMGEHRPRYVMAAFDVRGLTFRHVAYPEYKAGRPPMDDRLRPQFPIVKELLRAMGAGVYGIEGYEADDLLGTGALQAAALGLDTLLLTGDRDSLQLVGPRARLLYPQKGVSEALLLDEEGVKAHFGVPPSRITDLKGLMGDSSDNIKGVPGIGEKTALKLLAEYDTLENVLAHAGEVKGKLGERLRDPANQESARFSKELATIRTAAPLKLDPAECDLRTLSEARPAFMKYQLRVIAQRIDKLSAPSVSADAVTVSPLGDAQPCSDAPAAAHIRQTHTPDDLKRWADTLREGDAALVLSETELSAVCGETGVKAVLGGDLLSQGLDGREALRALSALFSRPIVTHDAKRLWHLLSACGLELPSLAYDELLAQYVLNPLKPDRTPPSDASALIAARPERERELQKQGMLSLYKTLELPLARVLFDMEREGFMVDGGALATLGEGLRARVAQLQETIYTMANVRDVNLNSPQQLGKLLFETLGLPAGRKTTRGYSTDADTLEALADEYEIVRPILEYRQLTKLMGTYIDGLPRLIQSDGRIHTTFDQTGTATGRISSSEPNLQNIPVRTPLGREIRRAFIAAPGRVLIDADYSQIELRILAHLSGDAAMRDAFLKGQDVHARTAAEVGGVPYEDVTPEMRSRAKAVNFGLVYGISDFGLARNIGVSRHEAAEFIARYFARYPGIQDFMRESVRLADERGVARTLLGRSRPMPELSGKGNLRRFGERVAMNMPIQGTAADIIKLAMVRVHEALASGGFKARLILQVHDELIIESPQDEAESVTELLRRCMENAMELSVPLSVDVKQGLSWYDTK